MLSPVPSANSHQARAAICSQIQNLPQCIPMKYTDWRGYTLMLPARSSKPRSTLNRRAPSHWQSFCSFFLPQRGEKSLLLALSARTYRSSVVTGEHCRMCRSAPVSVCSVWTMQKGLLVRVAAGFPYADGPLASLSVSRMAAQLEIVS